jgi:hypothetical protein
MMNQPVGKRYGESPMPLAPNSRSEGSVVESETVFVTAFSVSDAHCADAHDTRHGRA